MAFGTWRCPFPRPFGGNSVSRVSRIHDALISNVGDAMTTEQGTIAGGELVASARLLSLADRAIDRRVRQGQDPRKCSDPLLARWESILGIGASVNDSDNARRARVAARLLTNYGAGAGELSRIAATAFGSWTTAIHYNDATSAAMLWPGSTPSVPGSWYSTVALITVEYIRPMAATDDEARAKCGACADAFNEFLPAWTTFFFSETYSGDAYGFLVETSRLGFAALT